MSLFYRSMIKMRLHCVVMLSLSSQNPCHFAQTHSLPMHPRLQQRPKASHSHQLATYPLACLFPTRTLASKHALSSGAAPSAVPLAIAGCEHDHTYASPAPDTAAT